MASDDAQLGMYIEEVMYNPNPVSRSWEPEAWQQVAGHLHEHRQQIDNQLQALNQRVHRSIRQVFSVHSS